MEGVKYYANEPHLLGKALLRLERDFDKHVNYCSNEPHAQALLDSDDDTRDFFEVRQIVFINNKYLLYMCILLFRLLLEYVIVLIDHCQRGCCHIL